MRTRRMKAQQGILEYVLLTFFVLVVILALLFFLTWWQAVQLEAEKRSIDTKTTFSVMMELVNDPLAARDNSVLDDSKLMALQSAGCSQLEKVFGREWHARATLFEGDSDVQCTDSNYPDCNYWEMCPQSEGRCARLSYSLPVNIYRKVEERSRVGLLEVWSCR